METQESYPFEKYGHLKNTSSKDDFYRESEEQGFQEFFIVLFS